MLAEVPVCTLRVLTVRHFAEAAGVMFVLSVCLSVCENDNSRMQKWTLTKHGKLGQEVTI